MTRESTQKRIARDRAPRVQINYDVEIGDAIETKELPFVLGVLGDYAGHPREPLPRLKDRKFIQVDGENFDDVLKGVAPRLVVRVDDRLGRGDAQLAVELNFRGMEDFEPAKVAAQVEPLRKLLDARARLSDLRGKLAGNDKLEELLEQVIHDTDKLQALSESQGRKA